MILKLSVDFIFNLSEMRQKKTSQVFNAAEKSVFLF